MAPVPFVDIAEHGYQAGFRGQPHAIVVALTVPESGREARRANLTDPNGGSFGLCQINGVHDPAASGDYPNKLPTAEWIERMYDPAENLKAAYAVWLNAGRSFSPWGAYTNGLHLASMDAALAALDGRARIAARELRIAALKDEIASRLIELNTAIADRADAEAERDALHARIAAGRELIGKGLEALG